MSSRRAFTVDKQANGTEAGLGRVTEDAAGDERLGPVGMPIPVTAVDLRLLPAASGWRSLERATSTRVFGYARRELARPPYRARGFTSESA
jgi:hypothetical protein